MGPATVIAAGRRLAAPPRYHSNPYAPWEPQNARRFSAGLMMFHGAYTSIY